MHDHVALNCKVVKFFFCCVQKPFDEQGKLGVLRAFFFFPSPSLCANCYKSDDVLTAFRKYRLRGGILTSACTSSPAFARALSLLFQTSLRGRRTLCSGSSFRGGRWPCLYLSGLSKSGGGPGVRSSPSRWCCSCRQLCPCALPRSWKRGHCCCGCPGPPSLPAQLPCDPGHGHANRRVCDKRVVMKHLSCP